MTEQECPVDGVKLESYRDGVTAQTHRCPVCMRAFSDIPAAAPFLPEVIGPINTWRSSAFGRAGGADD